MNKNSPKSTEFSRSGEALDRSKLNKLGDIFIMREKRWWIDHPMAVEGDFHEQNCVWKKFLKELIVSMAPNSKLCFKVGEFIPDYCGDHIHVNEWGLTVSHELAGKILILGSLP